MEQGQNPEVNQEHEAQNKAASELNRILAYEKLLRNKNLL